jgi:hypothetical protein
MKCTPFNDSTALARFVVVAAAAAAAAAALIGRRLAAVRHGMPPPPTTVATAETCLENRVEVAAAHREVANMMNEEDDAPVFCAGWVQL